MFHVHSHLAIEAVEAMREKHPDEAFEHPVYNTKRMRAYIRANCPDNARSLLNVYRLRVLRLKEWMFYLYSINERDAANKARHRMIMRHKEYDARLSEFIKTNQ